MIAGIETENKAAERLTERNMSDGINQKKEKGPALNRLTILGVVLTAAGFLPFLLLGKGSVVTVNDQLDGEIFTYIYQAQYLLSGQNRIPEWMGGIGKEALFPPSMLTVLLYKLLPAFQAFLVNQFLVSVTAFLGMHAFVNKLTGQKGTAFFTALLFAYLPFYSVYGLTVAGIPMLVTAFWELSEPAAHRKRLFHTGLAACYGLTSSFVLLGYAVSGCVVLYGLILLFRRMRVHRGRGERAFLHADVGDCGWVFLAAALLIGLYAVCNLDLIRQALGIGTQTVSHKTEYVLHAVPFAESFWSMLLQGSGHAPSFHGWMLLPVLTVLAVCAPVRKQMPDSRRREYRCLGAFFLAALCIAAFYAWFHASSGVSLRQSLGGFFVYFQLDRIYWFYPFLWYAMLALVCSILTEYVRNETGWKRVLAGVFVLVMLCMGAFQVLWNSDLKRNVRQLAGPESSNAVTWEKYYGEEVFAQIAEAVGRDQGGYRVGSVALNPAAAAYNGFYTIDGYSNNYSLEYKHAFREVIAGELEKDQELKRYFDDWGNRCYLFTAQLGQSYYYEKDSGVTLSGLDWNMDALRKLGCEYILSGVEITDAERMGMTLLGSFEGRETDCRYRIWVYECGEDDGQIN